MASVDKRKRESESSVSSIGELDASVESGKQSSGKQKKKKGRKDDTDKNKTTPTVEEESSTEEEEILKESSNHNAMVEIKKALKEINLKLNQAEKQKEDYLKTIVPEIVKIVKEEMTKAFDIKLDKLESRLFDTEKENDELKQKIKEHQERAGSLKHQRKLQNW